MRRVVVASYLLSALAAESLRSASTERAENVRRSGDTRRDEPKVSWGSANIRDPLPYGKKARRQLRGGRHG